MNSVKLIGTLVEKPKLFTSKDNIPYTRFLLSVERPAEARRLKPNAQKYDYLPCIAWNDRALFVCGKCEKGDALCVIGRMQCHIHMEKGKSKRYDVEVFVEKVTHSS